MLHTGALCLCVPLIYRKDKGGFRRQRPGKRSGWTGTCLQTAPNAPSLQLHQRLLCSFVHSAIILMQHSSVFRKYIISRTQGEVPLSVPWDPTNQVRRSSTPSPVLLTLVLVDSRERNFLYIHVCITVLQIRQLGTLLLAACHKHIISSHFCS